MRKHSHAHHYVPEWYQRLFLPTGINHFKYLDQHPETVTTPTGRKYQRTSLLSWGPDSCFYRDDLYSFRFGNETTDEMERRFFGRIDDRGSSAVKAFAGFQGVRGLSQSAFQDFVLYMSAQRFRTPRGLDQLQQESAFYRDHNAVLAAMMANFQSYTAMWAEGIWEIVRASHSPTKFLLTDDPVTFYCKKVFPSEWSYPNDVSLKQIGTRTIFPLGLDRCMLITHLQLVRRPSATPTEYRTNARLFDNTMKHIGEIQFGRELTEDEVLRINLILKKRSTRYVAAAEKNWLYPERFVSTTNWIELDSDWFLLPNPWRIHFTTGIMAGGGNSRPFAMDEYGRKPWQSQYQSRRQRDLEWVTFEAAKREWAIKRSGKSRSRTDEVYGDVADKMIDDFLQAYNDSSGHK